MTRDDVLLNDVYFTSYNMNHQPLTPLTPISKIFASFDGIHSGVPTKTTPTLTPTTLKTIEQTFIELTNDTSLNIPCQAGFVPPPFQFEDHSQDRENSRESMSSGGSSSSWQVTPPPIISEDLDSKSSSTSFETAPHQQRPRSAAAIVLPGGGVATTLATLNPVNMVQQPQQQNGSRKGAGGTQAGTSRRNMGGRRPTKASNLSPEEEEKRRIRRERNKQAAARCRRRREDHTNELVDETDQLERKKQALQEEIKQLQDEKRDLEFLLENHREHCRLQGRSRSPLERKPMEVLQIQQLQQQQQQVQQQQQQQLQQQQQQQRIVRDLKIIPPLKIKAEPDELSEPPEKKAHLYSDSLETPTPTSIVAPVLTSANLPRLMLPTVGALAVGATTTTTTNGRPARPTNLDVKATTAFPLRNITMDAAGVSISTPSNGLFNFDSLMDGGTGLTPVAAPISLQSNRGPLDLITPTTSEPSKLCSL